MAGRSGNAKFTQKKVKVIAVDIENNLIFVKGSIVGANKGYLKVAKVN